MWSVIYHLKHKKIIKIKIKVCNLRVKISKSAFFLDSQTFPLFCLNQFVHLSADGSIAQKMQPRIQKNVTGALINSISFLDVFISTEFLLLLGTVAFLAATFVFTGITMTECTRACFDKSLLGLLWCAPRSLLWFLCNTICLISENEWTSWVPYWKILFKKAFCCLFSPKRSTDMFQIPSCKEHSK